MDEQDDARDSHGEARHQEDIVLTPAGPRSRDHVQMAMPRQAIRRNEDGTLSLVSEEAIHQERELRMLEEYVITPGGFRPKSRVHLIEPGHVVSGAGNRLRKLHFLGDVIADLGPLIPRPVKEPLMPKNVSHAPPTTAGVTPSIKPALGSGWIVYASWLNNTGHPVISF